MQKSTSRCVTLQCTGKGASTSNLQLQRSLQRLLADIRACRVCERELPLGARPVLRASIAAPILLVGQAPGIRVHQTGIPWDDPSGDRLRAWLGVSREEFYDERWFALVPSGFCYPGRGKSGDLPPRRECAELWREPLLEHLTAVKLTLLIGQYAQAHHLGPRRKSSLTETVRAWREYRPQFIPLPHPSGRNNIWLKRNPWFEGEVLPALRRTCKRLLAT